MPSIPNQLMRLLVSFIPCICLCSSLEASEIEFGACPELLATIQADGSVTAGSLKNLKQAYRAGEKLRVGWEIDWDHDGRIDITHWADASFLSEYKGTIGTQIASIRRQIPDPDSAAVGLDPGGAIWTGLIDTRGRLQGSYDDGEIKEQKVRSHWCATASSDRARDCASSKWRLAYHHDNDGSPIKGNKERLFDAVRRGYPIRLAWGVRSSSDPTASTAHAVDPVFVSLMRGDHLFAQLPEHIAQLSYWQPSQAQFDEPRIMWRGLIGTDGSFDAAWIDRATGETVKRHPQRAKVAWFYYGPIARCDNNQPVDLETLEGVIRATEKIQ